MEKEGRRHLYEKGVQNGLSSLFEGLCAALIVIAVHIARLSLMMCVKNALLHRLGTIET